jgi:hypothetical protein
MKNHCCIIYLLIMAVSIFSGVSAFAQKLTLKMILPNTEKAKLQLKQNQVQKWKLNRLPMNSGLAAPSATEFLMAGQRKTTKKCTRKNSSKISILRLQKTL